MRTRFLNTDYFAPSSSSVTLAFLNLPVSHLSLSSLSNDDRDPLLRLSSDSIILHVPLDLHQLPIDAALVNFLSDVIPQPINVDLRCFEAASPIREVEKEDENFCGKKEEESGRAFGFESCKQKDNAGDEKYLEVSEVFQFETPELFSFMENDFINENLEIQIQSEALEIGDTQDMLTSGLPLWYPDKVLESVYQVAEVDLEYDMEQNKCKLEDDRSSADQMLHQCFTLPLFEVDEISLGIMASHSMEDELLFVLANTEHQHWTEDDLQIKGREILGSVKYDMLGFLSENSLTKQCLVPEMELLLDFPEADIFNLVASSQSEDNSESSEVMSDCSSFSLTSPVIFQEFQMSDLDSSHVIELLFSTQKECEEVKCMSMFKDVNFKNFNDLIISHELALVDDAFKSLPTPVLSDSERKKSVHAVLEEILTRLKPQPLSASDGIYLDWQLLEEEKGNYKLYSHQKTLEEMDFRKIELEPNFFDDGRLISDFIFYDDPLAELDPNVEAIEQPLNIDSDSMLVGQNIRDTSAVIFHNRSPKTRRRNQSAEKMDVSSSDLLKSTPQSNDLDFVLNPQKAISREKYELTNKNFDNITVSSNSSTCVSTGTQLHQWDLTLHKIKLSDNILALFDIFEKSYLTILRNETTLSAILTSDDYKLLSLPKLQFMNIINEKLLHKDTCLEDENIVAYASLCSIKQMAWYTCFYGIHPARLYVDKLCQSLNCLKPRLGLLQQFIVDADRKVETDITKSHPSLTVIHGILRSNACASNVKMLILTEKVFWWTLKCLLTSMGLSFKELEKFSAMVDNSSEVAKAAVDALLVSDCILVSYELVSASFPFNKFDVILEYGGSNGSSRISSFSPKLSRLPLLHFLKVELDDATNLRALCEGVDMTQNMNVEGEVCSVETPNESLHAQKLREILNFVPVEDSSLRNLETGDQVGASAPFSPVEMESEHIQKMQSYPDAVIVVNTKNFNKEMIASRRVTYHRILAMEKKGVQVVERESDLPVDLIITPAICLVWYDFINIGKKASTLDEASSCLALCTENIATNVLTLLSFTFSGCILVFEGESSFISTVMESSDGLYAAAASLGIDLQLFYSHAPELTDDIIFNCIENSIALTMALYPKMPESQTFGEAFLNKFPSVNPLTAHAMLSCGVTLIKLFDCSREHRINSMHKYHVPEESMVLFSTLCKYGELEDSKSIMTDCSSSVSSGPGSDKCHLNIDCRRKQRKCVSNPDNIDTRMDNLLHFDSLDQFTNGVLKPSGVSRQCKYWDDSEILDEHQKVSSSLNDFFGKDQGLEFDLMKPSRISKALDAKIVDGFLVSKDINDLDLFLKDSLSAQKRGSKIARTNDLDWRNSESSNLFEGLSGEVIDLTSNTLSGKDFSSFPEFSHLSVSMPAVRSNSGNKPEILRRVSFGKSNHRIFPTVAEMNSDLDTSLPNFPTVAEINSDLDASLPNFPTVAKRNSDLDASLPKFPTAAEVNFDSDIWSSFKQTRVGSSQKPHDHPDTNYENYKLVAEQQKRPLEEVVRQRFGSSRGGSVQEKISSLSRTPLSNAVRSADPQPGSPWTIEFLNRIRQKSRLRQQSLPCNSPAPSFTVPGNRSKGTKRRSPSILEFFKYQGGSTPRKLPEKRQKQSMQSSIPSKNKRPSASFISTSTPADKKARQTLSYAISEGGSQTKLIWIDGSPDARRGFPRK